MLKIRTHELAGWLHIPGIIWYYCPTKVEVNPSGQIPNYIEKFVLFSNQPSS